MQWTEDQMAAIATRNKNLLVSAAAGSGKTALLIERIRRMVVDEHVPVKKLLVLTFTRAAAAEMKERLNNALMAELEKETVDSDYVISQLNSLGSASISTLHSFCATLVRDYFQVGGVDPEFTLSNETERSIMIQEALDEVFEEQYKTIPEGGTNGFSTLIDMFTGNRNDRELREIVESFFQFLATQPEPEAWCKRALAYFDNDKEIFWKSTWGLEMKQLIATDVQGACSFLKEAVYLCDGYAGFEKTFEQINAEYGRALELQERLKEDTAVFIEQICSFDFPRYKGATKVDKETSDTIKDLRNEAKSIIQGLQKNCSDNLEQSIHQLRAMKQPMTDLIALTKAFEQRFKAKKEAKNLLDFNDLEQVTLRILKEPKVAEEVQEQYSHVFLDEYQDTNEMQEAIISQIVRSDNYFMVGDVKQSIYRFRLADPSIFIGKYNRFKSEESGCDQLVTLSQNFRSCQGVIDSVNAVFERIMRPELGEITYDDDARLYKGLSAKGDYAKTAIHIIEDTSGDEDAEISEMSAVEIEARFIGREIQNRVGKAVFDTKSGTMQTLKYRDIGVLMRSVANRGEVFAKIFSELGIPAYFDGGDHYYESLEMGIILNLLTIIDNKAQDLPLLSVMTSPIGGFSISECTEIRLFNKEGAYYHCVQKYMEEREDALTFKLRAFYKNLDAFRDASKIMDIEDFLWKVYLDTGYYNFVGALPGGEQRQNNLRMLLKRAGDYKRSTLKGLFYFIQFVERMKKHRYDLSPPSILSEQENVVRIMTIHKSKGLEFPVVFLSGVGKRFNKRSNSGRILFHKELGICPEYVNLELRARTSTLARNICIAKNETEMLSEEMRLLYVAMTRAREQLVVVGTIKNKEKKWSQWTKPLQLYQLKKASGLLDWIMLSLVSETEQGRMEEESLNNLEYPSFNIHFYKAEESLKKHQNDWPENEALEIKTLVNKQIEKKVNERLGFVYKTAELDELPGKMTVTEINDLEVSGLKTAEIPERIIKPAFLMTEAEDYSAAERGTALHFMMQNLQLEKLRPVQGNWDNLLEVLEEERRRMIGHELIQAPLAKTIEIKHIGNFIESPLGRRLLSAPIVKREIPFNYCVSPGTIRTEWQEIKTPLVVQGMMDCFFMEGAQWVLLDYKTDRFYNMDGKKTLIERYKAQIEFYAKALEDLTKVPVKEKQLCLITMGETIKI